MKTTILVLILNLVLVYNVMAQPEYIPETDPLVLQKLTQWQDLKFGLLMHWGTYSQWGIVESWSICAEDEGWCRRNLEDYTEYKKKYQALQKTFNPVKFNPEKWARAARAAGMRYMVFTTKHHDGFCLFDSKYTDYKITDPSCPFAKNPRANAAKEIFAAFRNQGFMIGAYFSKPDWHSPYYWWPNFATPDRNVNYEIRRYPERWRQFVEFTHHQIDELMTDYGSIDILWLDGGWVSPLSAEEITELINRRDYKFIHYQSQDINMPVLVQKARAKQPGLIVVDRAVTGPYQNYLTPEAQVPEKTLPYPWETCMPMATSWSYVPNDTYKSERELIHMLVDVVSKGGNLLLNIGPDAQGEWAADAYDRLAKIGAWMQVNSEAIYASRPLAPFKEGKVCLLQGKKSTVYAIYLAGPNEENLPARIWCSNFSPSRSAHITLLGTRQKLDWESVGNGFMVTIPTVLRKHPPCKHAWALKIAEPE